MPFFVSSRYLIALLAGLALNAPAFAHFGDDPAVWLNRMSDALATVDYQGTFVYIHNDQAETMRIYHRVSDGSPRERLVSLNGTAREVIRDQDTVKCILPDDQTVFVEKRHSGVTLTRGIPLNAVEFREYYEFHLLGSGRIAGRASRLIAIRPKDAYRYGYRIWLDQETALPLRSELVNENEQPIEKMMFTEIEIGAEIPDAVLKPGISGEDFKWLVREEDDRAAAPAENAVSFKSLPPGYYVSRSEVHGNDARSYHLILTDGLASVSVFAEPLEDGKPSLAGMSRLGAVNAFGVRLEKHHVTVVGEVPEAAIAAIGEAVRIEQPVQNPQ